MRLSIFAKLFISHFIAIILVSGSVGTYFYRSAIDNLMQALQSRLQNSAALISRGLETAELDSIRSADDAATPLYRAYVDDLRAFVAANPDIAFIYVMRRNGEQVEFVLDSDPDEPAMPGEHYPHQIPSLMQGFVRPSVDAEITRDRWGSYLSGYSPLNAGSGQYLVGIDMRADDVRAKFEQIQLAGMLSLSFSVILAGLFSGLLSRNLTRRIRVLSARCAAVAPVDPDIEASARGDELDRLSQSFDSMATHLAEHQRSLREAHDDLEQRVEERTAELVRANDQLREEITERKRFEKMLDRASRTDYLTGALNRRAMTRRLHETIGDLQAPRAEFSVILMDVDHFKRINDSHGHDVGDRVLVQIVEVLRQGLRESDELSRWGGEEFLILLPNTAGGAAATLAARLCSRLEAAPFQFDGGELAVTGSFGVAQHSPGEYLDACLKRADQALYAAKAQGRNRVVSFPEPA